MDSIVLGGGVLQSDAGASLLVPLQGLISSEWVFNWLEGSGHRWRDRLFTPLVTFWACVLKQMQMLSARQTEDTLALLDEAFADSARVGKNFCKARRRLPLELLRDAVRYLGTLIEQRRPEEWRGRRIWLVDGTTVRMPRTLENETHFGLASNQHKAGHFPLLRLVFLVGGGLVLDVACGSFGTSELPLFIEILQRLPAGGVWVGDSLYGSYLNLALTQQRGSDAICCRHVNRQGKMLKRLTDLSHLERWNKPFVRHSHAPQLLTGLPEFLDVRVISTVVHRKGFRDFPLVLYTTLIDPIRYPDKAIVSLYLRRWNIELDIRTLKGAHGLERLTGKTPATVLRELYASLLAFNGIRALQAETGQSPRTLSCTRALHLILGMALRMSAASPETQIILRQHLLKLITQARLSQPPRLPQPRAVLIKRRYAYLSVSRADWRAQYHAA